nr:putative ribonuclease H-like domain-containing protein [Tanacetum cinerariifolium]
MFDLVKICHHKQFLCIHDDVNNLIKSALESKLLSINSINSQRLDKKEHEVKNVEEQPTERRNHAERSLQNFRVIHKSSISLKDTSQISSVHANTPILSIKEPENSLSMGYEHLSITPEMESESNAKNLLPISSKCEVTLKDKRECDELVCKNPSTIDVCDNHSEIFSNSNNDDDISIDDNAFEDIKKKKRLILKIFLKFKMLFFSDNSLLDNFSPEFKTFCDHSEETRSGNTTHANYSLPEYDSFCFEIEPDQERSINLVENDIPDNSSNDPLLEEVDLFLSDNSIPPGIENVADDPEGDIRFLKELLIDDSILSHDKYKTAQQLWAAILKTFGGNEATKKTKKNLLKQQYGNFKVEVSENLKQTFNRLQDMSWTGLPEFNDDTVTHYSRPAPTVESSPDDAQNKNPSVTETEASISTISPKSFIKFVKENDSPTKSKIEKADKAKKYPINKPQDDCNSDVPESIRNTNSTTTSTNPPADQLETLTVETPIPTVSSPVLTTCFTDFPKPSSDIRIISKRVANQVETPSLDNILTLTNRFEDILSVTTNSVDSDGVEADVSNMETTITASPTPTLRIHKDHPKSQIIGPVDTLIQTRNKSKEVLQTTVKSAFLYGTIDEEVYVMHPSGFQDPDFLAKVYKVEKAMYGLHQAPRAWYESPFDLVAYSDSDYSGATQDGKSTTGGCQFLGRRLISWQCKKQTIVATSTTEAKYVAAASCYGQVLWIQNQLLDYRSVSEQRTHEFIHVYLASVSVDVVPTASLVFATATMVTPYRRRKGKEIMVESETPKKKKVQEQIEAQVARELEEQMAREDQRMSSKQVARDAEVARIHAEEELQIMINSLARSNETIEDFILIRSKEEVERFKRKGIRFEKESVKKLKTSEEVHEEVKIPDEIPEEKVKEMMQMVPIEEVYVEALQVKHPIIDWKVYTEGQRSY